MLPFATVCHRFSLVVFGLLFLAATINYIDRQILALLKPILEHEPGWRNEEPGFSTFVAWAEELAERFLAVGEDSFDVATDKQFIDQRAAKDGVTHVIPAKGASTAGLEAVLVNPLAVGAT